ncbi:MAG: alcohol dehydrogenase catalytic domain-containing protein, partial [Clostridia bacterium]|nr:alcohol dehydrogenase catalytic domain-containing protein [Clostridia bacterium]
MVLREFPVPRAGPGAVVVRVTHANICGSDLHAWRGEFVLSEFGGRLPTVLGHEMCGRVHELGEGVTTDWAGEPLAVGDRVVFQYFRHCGRCPACLAGHTVACRRLRMAMTESAEEWPHFVGAFADYYYVHPGQAVFKVPDDLPDELVAGANCALSQVLYGLERVGLRAGETVAIQGAGGLGIYATAVARDRGAARIIVIDGVPERLELALAFGADEVVDIRSFPLPED